jgi:hypothetical protein
MIVSDHNGRSGLNWFRTGTHNGFLEHNDEILGFKNEDMFRSGRSLSGVEQESSQKKRFSSTDNNT